MVALGYNDGSVYLFHSDELREKITEPQSVIHLEDEIIDMAFI